MAQSLGQVFNIILKDETLFLILAIALIKRLA
jgi:hypothetical protein